MNKPLLALLTITLVITLAVAGHLIYQLWLKPSALSETEEQARGGASSPSTPKTQVCSDGTPYGKCSQYKPYFCENGTLVEKCWLCGCPSGVCVGKCEYVGAEPREMPKAYSQYLGKCLPSLEDFIKLTGGEGKPKKEGKPAEPLPGILMLVSEDGVKWSEVGIVVEGVGVPDLEVLSDGRLALYHPGDAGRGDFCSVSRDGYKWAPGNCTIEGMRSLELLDPEVVRVEGGYRMYFFGGNLCPLEWQGQPLDVVHVIYAAYSADGIHWRVEGEAFKDVGVMDPEVGLVDGEWIMCLSKMIGGRVEGEVATSRDGLNFTKGGDMGACALIEEYKEVEVGGRKLRYARSSDGRISIQEFDGTSWKEIAKLDYCKVLNADTTGATVLWWVLPKGRNAEEIYAKLERGELTPEEQGQYFHEIKQILPFIDNYAIIALITPLKCLEHHDWCLFIPEDPSLFLVAGHLKGNTCFFTKVLAEGMVSMDFKAIGTGCEGPFYVFT